VDFHGSPLGFESDAMHISLDGKEHAEFVWKSKHVRIAVAGHRVYVACAIESDAMHIRSSQKQEAWI
jgi:hypothetical protein